MNFDYLTGGNPSPQYPGRDNRGLGRMPVADHDRNQFTHSNIASPSSVPCFPANNYTRGDEIPNANMNRPTFGPPLLLRPMSTGGSQGRNGIPSVSNVQLD